MGRVGPPPLSRRAADRAPRSRPAARHRSGARARRAARTGRGARGARGGGGAARGGDPGVAGVMRSIVRALLLTDVVDSTKLAETLGDDASAWLWSRHDRLARDLLVAHG